MEDKHSYISVTRRIMKTLFLWVLWLYLVTQEGGMSSSDFRLGIAQFYIRHVTRTLASRDAPLNLMLQPQLDMVDIL